MHGVLSDGEYAAVLFELDIVYGVIPAFFEVRPRVLILALASVWRFAQIGFRRRTGHPGDIPGGIDRDEHQGIV